MSEAFWQAKIWGLLHDPALKALHNNQSGRGENSFWQQLEVMLEWVENKWNPEDTSKKILEHIHISDYIASASDRGAIGSVTASINYAPKDNLNKGLDIFHLLSGAKLDFKIKQHSELIRDRRSYLQQQEAKLLQAIPEETQKDIKRLFWWLWRCLPQATCDLFADESLMLMPAETRLPDSSIWSHTSLTAALAGALAGFDLTAADIQQTWPANKTLSHPYLATFSFTPIQEQIKASRKMRDFWAGSWILHYLSAAVCWKLAQQYGPDTFLYPSLFQQPLIDHWLLKENPEFSPWIKQPSTRSLLTAGFPNVLVLILPKDKVAAAMETAYKTVLETWRELGDAVFDELHDERRWMRGLQPNSSTWKGWLDAQWQTYWTAIPIGKEGEALKNAAIPEDRKDEFESWLQAQNKAYNLVNKQQKLFQDAEIAFLRQAYQQRFERQGRKFSVNVGSWWPGVFDQTRFALSAIKNARTWQIPTAFGPRSTISGIGPVVHPGGDWITEGETKKLWQRQAGLFDGREQLNATETVKRGLEKVLPQLLKLNDTESEEVAEAIAASYPDLTAGVAGYLKVNLDSETPAQRHFNQACQAIIKEFPWTEKVLREMRNKWGIPWLDDSPNPKKYHPRLLNAGWLVEDAETDALKQLQSELDQESDPEMSEELSREITKLKFNYRSEIQKIIDSYYPSNNPADWYVLAAGDGDSMSEWLKGKKLEDYREYVPSELVTQAEQNQLFKDFLDLPKRMGPSTHNALSRALLDFSNQLVPYLTERRYAGRLIYGGGDDVLAYTNLWEWDKWLWDIRQCFRGDKDPSNQFSNAGDYWQWQGGELPEDSSGKPLLSSRPLFTMGQKATISFGVVIANHSVPLAIALENLWDAEKEAKKHHAPDGDKKDAVQVRILYGNGNTLKSTAKFAVFQQWQQLLTVTDNLESAIFEQAATLWSQHPVPVRAALQDWTRAFCIRRDFFQGNGTTREEFGGHLEAFLNALWKTTANEAVDTEVQNWLKLAAFVLRNRDIKLGGPL